MGTTDLRNDKQLPIYRQRTFTKNSRSLLRPVFTSLSTLGGLLPVAAEFQAFAYGECGPGAHRE